MTRSGKSNEGKPLARYNSYHSEKVPLLVQGMLGGELLFRQCLKMPGFFGFFSLCFLRSTFQQQLLHFPILCVQMFLTNGWYLWRAMLVAGNHPSVRIPAAFHCSIQAARCSRFQIRGFFILRPPHQLDVCRPLKLASYFLKLLYSLHRPLFWARSLCSSSGSGPFGGLLNTNPPPTTAKSGRRGKSTWDCRPGSCLNSFARLDLKIKTLQMTSVVR